MATYSYWEPAIAEGGEKVVYRGRQDQTGNLVAIKFLKRPFGPQDRLHFSREVERAVAGKDAGIAQIIDFNLEWDPPFYVEEFFPNGTLAERMARAFAAGRVFTAGASLHWIRQILTQLAGLHDRNIIHRDIKPPNLLMRGDDVVLGDLGIGRTANRPTLLQTRAFVGTRGYASPEQELGSRVDRRSDLYSVGVVLHELLTGRRGGHDALDYGGRKDVLQLLAWLLAYQPARRPGDCRTVLAHVQRLLTAT